MLKYALIGFGGLGKLHLGNLLRLEQERPGEIKLCAICGTTKEAATGAVQTNLGAVDMSKVDFSACGHRSRCGFVVGRKSYDFDTAGCVCLLVVLEHSRTL